MKFMWQCIPSRGPERYGFSIHIGSSALDWQVSSIAQISNALGQAFYTVEHLIFAHDVLHDESSEERSNVDHTDWQKLLRSFSDVKTLRSDDGLIEGLLLPTIGQWRAPFGLDQTLDSDLLSSKNSYTQSSMELKSPRHTLHATMVGSWALLQYYARALPPSHI